MLRALAAASPRERPEIVSRLRRVTSELLQIEINGPLRAVPEHPETDEHRLKWYQR